MSRRRLIQLARQLHGVSGQTFLEHGRIQELRSSFSRAIPKDALREVNTFSSFHQTLSQNRHAPVVFAFQQLQGYSTRRTTVKRLSRASQRVSQPIPQRVPTEVIPQETSPAPAEVADVVDHSALIIARPLEWFNVLLGFEQANRYTVYDGAGEIVAHLLEEEGSIGRAIGRQLLRTRRPFTATILNPAGDQIIFRLRRPAYLISSTMYIEDGAGERIGEVQQRWHLWKRRYELFLGQRQFAAVDGGFLAWEFELKDERGETLALIDRNFSGFGKELFTDAGRYAIHFGGSPLEAAQQIRNAIEAAHPDRPAPPVTALAKLRTDVAVIPTQTGNQLSVIRPLALDERMIALACAISIDYDFFSRHSYGGGVLSPFVHPPMIPFPIPMGGGAAEGAAEAAAEGSEGAAAGGAVGGAGDNGDSVPSGAAGGGGYGDSSSGGSSGDAPLERNLGGDEWDQPPKNDESGGGGWGWGGDDDNDDGGGGEGGGGLSDIMGLLGWGDDD